jgi:hypothetical protein
MDFLQPLLQKLLVFFEQLRVLRRAVDFARFVLSFREFLLCPLVMNEPTSRCTAEPLIISKQVTVPPSEKADKDDADRLH